MIIIYRSAKINLDISTAVVYCLDYSTLNNHHEYSMVKTLHCFVYSIQIFALQTDKNDKNKNKKIKMVPYKKNVYLAAVYNKANIQ